MSLGGPGVQSAMDELYIHHPGAIVEQIAAQRRRHTRSFRLTFVATWFVIVGALVGWLMYSGKVDMVFIQKWDDYILEGIPITLFVAATSITFAIVLAVLGALGRLSGNALVFSISTLYVSLVRGTPLIVQILFIYLALPQIWEGFAGFPSIALAIFALAFNYGAYMTETFRAGIQAVPRGQLEAAAALGMPERTTMRRVVLPQAIRIITPAIGNEFISMIKDSALVSIVAVQPAEILWRARTVGQSNFRTLETLLLAALVYWVLTIVLSLLQDRLEKRMARSDVRI
jgi:polar amino acid transport system permease protein